MSTTVCQWIGYCLCMRDHPIKKDKIMPPKNTNSSQVFDAVIVWKETQKKTAHGLAFEVILEPATAKSPRPLSPPKERPLSQEIIQQKLKDAENRRQSLELERLERITRSQQREIAQRNKVEKVEAFSKEAENKLMQRMNSMEEKKNAQMQALQERLREHAKRVEEVRQASDNYRSALKERIEKKMETMQENREAQFKSILERLVDHESHVKEVLETSAHFSKRTEEKLLNKMESTLKNRENQLQQLMERLKDHERHVQEVRQNKLNLTATEVSS